MKIVKKDGKLEEYNSEKLRTSIENSSKETNCILNESDLNYIQKEVEKTIKFLASINKKIVSSREIRMILFETLKNCGFNQIAKAYMGN